MAERELKVKMHAGDQRSWDREVGWGKPPKEYCEPMEISLTISDTGKEIDRIILETAARYDVKHDWHNR